MQIQANFVIMNRPREHLDSLLRWLGRREGARSLQNDISNMMPGCYTFLEVAVIMNHIMI